jgi:hypothetical protein
MSAPLIAALCFTSILLVTTAYFPMGSEPLLNLEHDTPMDARFVRRFFEVCYTAALMEALGVQIQAGGAGAIRAFRRFHGVAIGINLAQLVVVVWSVIVNVR